ncbi:hypothetical protein [uncultured Pontibacter sp.]|uniref:hypothetical protein n=1 Tax=uncultured Pontibacter sp. TaxID=453356 RepID=UPI002634C3EA|nr:hypothetical protein [uncultured Pontibacter sp.]
MVRGFILALLLVGGITCAFPTEAAPGEGPKLQKLFQKKGGKSKKLFKKKKKTVNYHRAAAKKQRKAKWQRYTMVQ